MRISLNFVLLGLCGLSALGAGCVRRADPGRINSVRGTVIAVEGPVIRLSATDPGTTLPGQLTFHTTDATAVTIHGQPADVTDLRPDDFVALDFDGGGRSRPRVRRIVFIRHELKPRADDPSH